MSRDYKWKLYISSGYQGQHSAVEPCKNHQELFKTNTFFDVSCQNRPAHPVKQNDKMPQFNINVNEMISYLPVPKECQDLVENINLKIRKFC